MLRTASGTRCTGVGPVSPLSSLSLRVPLNGWVPLNYELCCLPDHHQNTGLGTNVSIVISWNTGKKSALKGFMQILHTNSNVPISTSEE